MKYLITLIANLMLIPIAEAGRFSEATHGSGGGGSIGFLGLIIIGIVVALIIGNLKGRRDQVHRERQWSWETDDIYQERINNQRKK